MIQDPRSRTKSKMSTQGSEPKDLEFWIHMLKKFTVALELLNVMLNFQYLFWNNNYGKEFYQRLKKRLQSSISRSKKLTRRNPKIRHTFILVSKALGDKVYITSARSSHANAFKHDF